MKYYVVTLAMRAQDGTGYSAQRFVKASDPDDASTQGWELEHARQQGCKVPHHVLMVAMVRKVREAKP